MARILPRVQPVLHMLSCLLGVHSPILYMHLCKESDCPLVTPSQIGATHNEPCVHEAYSVHAYPWFIVYI